jgi:hypothetical protein
MNFIDKQDLMIMAVLVFAAALIELSGLWFVRVFLMAIGLIGAYFIYKWGRILMPLIKWQTAVNEIGNNLFKDLSKADLKFIKKKGD